MHEELVQTVNGVVV
jgi:hypothetical protein